MRTVKRITKIHKIEGYNLYCLFNNGESRIINFLELFNSWNLNLNDDEYIISKSIEEFNKVELVDGTLSWNNVTTKGIDEDGNEIEYPYQLDPIVLYENSVIDPSREVELGMLIKQTRHDLGLTQEELADKSGTTKHYISRVENNRTGIELSTLKRIIEGGFGKRMQINIM
ncbi:MAG: helix-turn-helix domain-containing protein [Saprospiraceae bacterium]|nr:helix-turn-helix domain-containing protein [Saprospiraceae bacterium]HMS68051.1 helix-turn-helix domain-containing protein [Saprospiraceae bacterium]